LAPEICDSHWVPVLAPWQETGFLSMAIHHVHLSLVGFVPETTLSPCSQSSDNNTSRCSCGIAGVRCYCGLNQQKVSLVVRNRTVLDATRHNKHLARP
jgi:hypothetical protein